MESSERNEHLYSLSTDYDYWKKRLTEGPEYWKDRLAPVYKRRKKSFTGFPEVTPANKEAILKFLQSTEVNDTCGDSRRLILIEKLTIIAGMLGKDFQTASEDDLRGLTSQLKAEKGKSLKLYRECLMEFYKWLNGGHECPANVRWWKNPRNCPSCDPIIIPKFSEYNETKNLAIFNEVSCECKYTYLEAIRAEEEGKIELKERVRLLLEQTNRTIQPGRVEPVKALPAFNSVHD